MNLSDAGGEVSDGMEEEGALRRLLLTEGDREGVARVVVERVVPRLGRFLTLQFPTLANEDALDLAATALTIALQRREQFRPGPEGRARTRLYGIAKRQALEFVRRRGSLVPLYAPDDEPNGAASQFAVAPQGTGVRDAPGVVVTESPKDLSTLSNRVMGALLALPEQQRRAALDHYVDGIPATEIDVRYGWKPNTAQVYLTRARATLRRRLLLAEVAPDRSVRLANSDPEHLR